MSAIRYKALDAGAGGLGAVIGFQSSVSAIRYKDRHAAGVDGSDCLRFNPQ